MTSDAKARPAAKGGETAEIIKTIVFALLLYLVIHVLVFQPFTIPSASMEPNLFEGDYLLVSKYSYGYSRHSIPFSPKLFSGRVFFRPPRRGDIVVFKLPRDNHMDYIKRLIGLPGDSIQVKRGLIYINGVPIPRKPGPPGWEDMGYGEPRLVARYTETLPGGRQYLTNSYGDDGQAENTGVYVVPPHCYFMMGDNRDNSLDSRFDPYLPPSPAGATCPWNAALDKFVDGEGVGFVPEENLEGRARVVLFSHQPGTYRLRPDRFGKVL